MYTAAFDYVRAHKLEDVVAWLQEDPDQSKVLAGGHSLIPLMKLRLTTVDRLIDISGVAELHGVQEVAGGITIGAMTSHREVSEHPLVRAHAPLAAQCAGRIGDLQVRNRGTIGGSLCHADPASDLPAAMLAHGAEMVIAGPNGTRQISYASFLLAPFVTTLGPAEVLQQIFVPALPPGGTHVYLKRPHPASGYPLTGVALWVKLSRREVQDSRIALTGSTIPLPIRAEDAERELQGHTLDAAHMQAAAEACAASQLWDNDSDGYQKNLCRVYVARALAQASQAG